GEPLGRGRGGGNAAQPLDDVVDGLGAGDGSGEVGDQDLAVDQLGDELRSLLRGDLAVGIEGHQRLDDLAGAGAAAGAAQDLLQVVVVVHGDQVVRAGLLV